jgi:ribosomal protein S16
MKRKPLKFFNKKELHELCDALGIDYEKGDTNAVLVAKIEESGKYDPKTEKPGAPVQVDKESGKRIHPQLGEYKSCIVHSRDPKEGSIFASINLYTVEFQPGEKISLPVKMIEHLRKASKIEHYYDPHAISENGNIGAHMSREVPRYIVEIVED